jgi:hypothetical protein
MAERNYEHYSHELDEASRIVLRGLYRHYASDGIYQFDGLSIDKESEGTRVHYHDIRYPRVFLSTTIEIWTEKVETDDGIVQRYVWLPGEEINSEQ